MISVIIILMFLIGINVLPNAYNILAISGILFALNFKYPKVFQKAGIWYVLFLALGGISIVFNDLVYFDVLNKGFIGYGFMIVVMFSGVLPNKWEFTRNLKRNRGVLSILSFITITPHIVLHLFQIYDGIDLFGVGAYIVMVPLTVISFKLVKAEIPVKDWLMIQKAAYGVYIILFVHLIVVSEYVNKIVYVVLLVLYINNKLYKEFKK